MTSRLPITDLRRIRARDDKLWIRERDCARLYQLSKIPCPCTEHKGLGIGYGIEEVKRHLLRYGRSSECRTWRGPQEPDSSDEEWESDFTHRMSAACTEPRIQDSGIEVRSMLQHLYEQVQTFTDNEEMLNTVTMSAMETVDAITGINRTSTTGLHDEGEDGTGRSGTVSQNAVGNDRDISGPEPELNQGDVDSHAPGDSNDRNRPSGRDEAPFDAADHMRLEDERMKDAKAMEDAMQLLYPGSNHSKLAATIMVVNLVATHSGITEKAADDMLATFKCLLPTDNILPGSLYQAKALTKRLGLDFCNIDGCATGCVLYDEDHTKHLDRCPQCSTPRYKDMFNRTRPLKVLRQFPVIPRLQRFYRIPVLSKLMRWYDENRSGDDKVRFPADSRAWKRLDNLDPALCDTKGFGTRIQDVRIQISCDGICPFKLHKSSWSAWPVLASLLNLPPWLITKKFFTMLCLLIPGKSQVPFQYFDVWMRPLVEELKELWRGVTAYDVLEPEGSRVFKLRAAVLYTTHDFPGYGTVSGAVHQGYVACPPCGDQLRGRYAYESKKLTYRDARRWVGHDHPIRSPRFDYLFDGQSETRSAPIAKTPQQQRRALEEYRMFLAGKKRGRESGSISRDNVSENLNTAEQSEVGQSSSGHLVKRRRKCLSTEAAAEESVREETGAGQSSGSRVGRKRKQTPTVDPSETGAGWSSATHGRKKKKTSNVDPSKIHGIKRGSILYELPYWEHLEIRNSLDVMHCEKNFAENILKTICGFKEKDNVKVRRDMQREGIRRHLWMVKDPSNPSRMLKPAANYVLSPKEFDIFCTRLEKVKVPSGYSSDMGSLIRNKKFSALKSHDYHILMQSLLPLALRGLMEPNTRTAIMRASRVFRRICCKVWDPSQEDSLLEDVAITICLMEMTFPLTFFDIMSHLPLHVVKELFILGPVQVRWMYPVERTMMTLKNHVKNRARPEASISHGYLLDETMGFCMSYMHGFDVVRRRVWDADPEDSAEYEVLEGASTEVLLSRAQRDLAHKYVVRNNTLTYPYFRQWEEERQRGEGTIPDLEVWLRRVIHVADLDMSDPNEHDTVLLSNSPSMTCKRYKKMKAYGNHWRVNDETGESMGNFDSGVACFETNEYSSGAGKDYVGLLEDIFVLDYGDLNTPIILFSSQWKKRFDSHRNSTYIRDGDGFLVVNFKHNLPKQVDPFVFPSQCTQVFFSDDDLKPAGSQWKVIMRKEARSRRTVVEDDDIFISTNVSTGGVVHSGALRNPPNEPDLAGAIVLNDVDNAIALQSFENVDRARQITRKRLAVSGINRHMRRKS